MSTPPIAIRSTFGREYAPVTPPTPTPAHRERSDSLAARRERSKNWVFTLNNYCLADEERLQALGGDEHVNYIIYGREVAPTTGMPHLQGFIQFKSRKEWLFVQSTLPFGCFFERARGNAWQAAEYCRKEDEHPFEMVNLD